MTHDTRVDPITADEELLDSLDGTSYALAPIDVGLMTSGVVLKAFRSQCWPPVWP